MAPQGNCATTGRPFEFRQQENPRPPQMRLLPVVVTGTRNERRGRGTEPMKVTEVRAVTVCAWKSSDWARPRRASPTTSA